MAYAFHGSSVKSQGLLPASMVAQPLVEHAYQLLLLVFHLSNRKAKFRREVAGIVKVIDLTLGT